MRALSSGPRSALSANRSSAQRATSFQSSYSLMCTDGHTLYQGGTCSSARTIGTSRLTMRRLSRSPSRVISGVTSVRMPLTRSARLAGWSTRTCTTSAIDPNVDLVVVGEAALEDRVGAVQRVGDVHRVADAHVVEHHQQRLRAGERALLEPLLAAQQFDARAFSGHAARRRARRGLVQRERLVRRVEVELGLRHLANAALSVATRRERAYCCCSPGASRRVCTSESSRRYPGPWPPDGAAFEGASTGLTQSGVAAIR